VGVELLFQELDFLYLPSRDIEADLRFYTGVLGARVVWAIEAFGTRVAEVKMSPGATRLILAEHLEGEAPVLLHRVEDLDTAIASLEERGLDIEARFGFPHGPAAQFRSPGGQRLAIYELTRPGADEHLAGRFDFGTG
jgi:catechol 2,3-dioxygenase-like lactoylglutathione lyase family enzyme